MRTQDSRTECFSSPPEEQVFPSTGIKKKFEPTSAISSCSEELRPALDKINTCFPELLRVMQAILQKPIQIVLENREGFKAEWDWAGGIIKISRSRYEENPKYNPLVDLIFEMQNACYTFIFKQTHSRASTLTKMEYVEEFEGIERSTTKLTYVRLQSLPETVFPQKYNEFKYTYLEDPDLFYLHQQVASHSFTIAERYSRIEGTLDKTEYEGTWETPLVDEKTCKALHELLAFHLEVIRLGQGEKKLRELIGYVETYAKEGEIWAQDVLINLEFFNEKYMTSQYYPSNSKVPLYKPDRNKLELFRILDQRKKDLLL